MAEKKSIILLHMRGKVKIVIKQYIYLERKITESYLCEVCGFNFEEFFGERGKNFIEVHHNKPLYIQNKEEPIDPEKDLTCLCSNCHRMIHRDKGNVLTVQQLKNMIKKYQ